MADMPLPETVYHYCSLQTAVAILQTKTLRLSSIFHMNDHLEQRWFGKLALEVLEREFKDQGCYSYDEEYRQIRRLVENVRQSDVFCACFSSKKDSLGQWRAYADNGYGVALGFDLRALGFEDEDGVLKKGEMEICQVEYDIEVQQDAIRKGIRSIRAHCESQTDPLQAALAPDHLSSYVWHLGSVCKNGAFAEEEEWRIIYRRDFEHGPKPDSISKLGVVVNGRTLVPFYTMSFDPRSQATPVRSISVGPQVSKETIQTLFMFLKAEGYNIKEIGRSQASYRSL